MPCTCVAICWKYSAANMDAILGVSSEILQATMVGFVVFNPFLASVPISGVFSRYKTETLNRNRLI